MGAFGMDKATANSLTDKMKSLPTSLLRNIARCALPLVLVGVVSAAEMRAWTNLKGQKINAQLLSVDGDNVRLRMEGGRDVTIERKTLSLGDQQYLKEFGGAEEIPIDPKAKLDMPAKKVKIDSKTLVRRDDKFLFPIGDSELEFDILETPHFLVMSSGRASAKDTGELAERLYHEMAFQHPGFEDKWGDEKKAIFICGDESDYAQLGAYYQALLEAQGQGLQAQNSRLTWPHSSGAGFRLGNDLCDKYKVKPSARAFKAYNRATWKRGVWNPFPTHCIAGDVLRVQMGGIGGAGAEGYFAISVGHCYFKEIQLCDETVTSLINADSYESDELVKAGGFDDGRKWARTLRDLVKRGKVEPTLKSLYRVEDAGDLSPELTVTAYGLARYMQSTPARLAKFSKFMERVDTSQAVPVAEEMAKIFGFETVEEFETDWIEYMKSTAFK